MEFERIFADARASSDDELIRICALLEEKMLLKADTTEVTIYFLRQIYQIIFTSKRYRKLADTWKSLLKILVRIIKPEREPDVSFGIKAAPGHKLKEITLALHISKEMPPISPTRIDSYIDELGAAAKDCHSPIFLEQCLALLVSPTFVENVTAGIVRVASSKNSKSSSRSALILLQALLRRNSRALTLQDVTEISGRISQGLVSGQSSVSSSHKAGVVGRRIEPVTELDGTPSRDLFTVLSISHHLSSEQLMNTVCFSLLKNWLLITKGIGSPTEITLENMIKGRTLYHGSSPVGRLVGNSQFFDQASSTDSDSLGTASLSSSMSSLHSYLYIDDSSGAGGLESSSRDNPLEHQQILKAKNVSLLQSSPRETSQLSQGVRSGFGIENATLKYCKRILSQYERVPKLQDNVDVAKAACLEALENLSMLCQENEAIIQQVFPEIKRLKSKISQNPLLSREIHVGILQFFISNHESTIYDVEESLTTYLRDVPGRLFNDPSASFELVDFCLKNKSYFELHPQIVQKFYPNILKIIAWHPRTFLQEYMEILPLFANKHNAAEVFNSLLDLPSLSLLLEFINERKITPNGEFNTAWNLGDTTAFPLVQQRSLFSHLLRKESTGTNNIDTMGNFYQAVSSYVSRTRIAVTCQIVPILLDVFFDKVVLPQSLSLSEMIFPLLCTRLFMLFPVSQFQRESRRILSQKAKDLCVCDPSYLSTYQESIISVIYKARNGGPAALDVLSNFFDVVGRFASRPKVCNPEQTLRYYETLETMLYESANVFSGELDMPCNGKSLAILVSSTAKLSACSQDFVPRTILCLSKLTSHSYQRNRSPLSQEEYAVVMERTQELLGILRMPNVAQSILCGSGIVTPWHLDKDTSVLMKVHAIARQSDVHK